MHALGFKEGEVLFEREAQEKRNTQWKKWKETQCRHSNDEWNYQEIVEGTD